MCVLMYEMGSMIVLMYEWIYRENNWYQPPSQKKRILKTQNNNWFSKDTTHCSPDTTVYTIRSFFYLL